MEKFQEDTDISLLLICHLEKRLHLCLAYLFYQKSIARDWQTGLAIACYDFSSYGCDNNKNYITFEIQKQTGSLQQQNTHRSLACSLTALDLFIHPD